MKYLRAEPFGVSVPGCKKERCGAIYMLCWVCGYCPDHCDCPLRKEEEIGPDPMSEMQKWPVQTSREHNGSPGISEAVPVPKVQQEVPSEPQTATCAAAASLP